MKNSLNIPHEGSDFYISLVLILLSLGYLTPSTKLLAQDLKFKHLSIEDGLSHSKVNCIYQDSRGFMWFGTNEGLNKYNGYEFTIFQRDPDNPRSISANLIRCILEDSKGHLWIGTEAGGLNLFDRDLNTFTHFTSDSTSDIRISGNNVNTILEDSRGNLWLGSEKGLGWFDLENKRVINYLPYPQGSHPQLSNEVTVLLEDRKNNLWVGTLGGGLYLFDRDKKTFTYYPHCHTDIYNSGDNEIRSIHEDLQGNLWLGTTNEGLNLFDRENNRFQRFYPGRDNPESTTIRAILDDGRGNLWIGNRSGLYNFDRKTHQFVYYGHDPNNPYSLSQNSVLVIFKDRKGDLWIGTRDGINFLNTTNLPFIHYRADANNRRCLNKQAVYAILEDHNGDLWFGTEHGGLNHLDRKTGLFTYYTYDIKNPNSLSVNNIKALLEDRDGNLWIGTFNGGVNLFDRKTRRFIHYLHDPNDPASLSINNVMALLEDRDGELWIGTYGGGLDRFDKKNRRFIHILPSMQNQGFNNIYTLIQDREEKIWIGASENKIGCLDKSTGEFTQYQLNLNIRNVDIRSIFEDQKGNLWFGTVGGGLYFFNKKEKTFRGYTRKNGLPSNIVYGILQDSQGHLWLSTTNGLSKFNPRTEEFKNYYQENGLQSDQFNYNAYLKTRSGEMFFGGINGVTAFHPDRIRENTYLPPVVITDFRIFNKPVAIGGKDGILQKHITETKAITLSHKHSVFSFEFAALNYAISERNQYAYKMEGFDEDWVYVGTRRFATYTNLNPGTYTFRVKATNNDGLWNEEGTSIRIEILPPLWKTWWFKLILGALFLLIVKHFIDYQNQKRNILKATALANEAQLKLLRYQMNPHFLFNVHNSIRSMIHIDKDQAWQMITELSEFIRYSLLNFNKVHASLDEEINAVNNYLRIEKIRYRDSLEVSFEIDDSARKCILPAFTFQPLIENAIKYGRQTSTMPLKVIVAILYKQGVLSIDVSNSGRLIHPSSNSTKDHGTSLENIKQRLEIMFKDQYTFQLYEENDWVHAKIRIQYDKARTEEQVVEMIKQRQGNGRKERKGNLFTHYLQNWKIKLPLLISKGFLPTK